MRDRVVTRQGLYEQVWMRSISSISADYGISDRGLTKVCMRLGVPTPARGYWTKVAAGHQVAKPILPPLQPGMPDRYAFKRMTDQPKAPRTIHDILTKADKLQLLPVKLRVPERLTNPHPIIATWIVSRQRVRAETQADQSSSSFRTDPGKFSEIERRRHRILDTIFKAIESHGGRAEDHGKRGLFIGIGPDRIEVTVREKKRQVRIPLSELQRSYRPQGAKTHRQELEPTGFLIFEIKSYLGGAVRSKWVENDTLGLEQMVSDAFPFLIAALEVVKEIRLAREEQAKSYRLREAQAAEEKRHLDADRDRWNQLVKKASDWKEQELVLQFLEAQLNRGSGLSDLHGSMDETEWWAWIEGRLGRIQKTTRVPTVTHAMPPMNHNPQSS
jgi:hypothetical protein